MILLYMKMVYLGLLPVALYFLVIPNYIYKILGKHGIFAVDLPYYIVWPNNASLAYYVW